MTAPALPSVPDVPDVVPRDWNGTPQGLRVSIAGMNEFGLPLDPRTMTTRLPADPANHDAFAQAVADTVRNTILVILGHPFTPQEPRP